MLCLIFREHSLYIDHHVIGICVVPLPLMIRILRIKHQIVMAAETSLLGPLQAAVPLLESQIFLLLLLVILDHL